MTLTAPRLSAAELADEVRPEPVRSGELVMSGYVWDVRRDVVDLGEAGEVTREYVDHPGAVSVVALRQDRGQDEVALIRQYRHPVRSHEWELPAGLLDMKGESPVAAAARELAEEADLRAGRWHLLSEYFSSPGGLNEAKRIFLARDLSDVPVGERFEREAEELGMPVRWAVLDEAVEAILAGTLRNSAATIGLLAAYVGRARGWSSLRAADEPWTTHPAYHREP
ncbi:MAG TPA: NUDIX hydrolase [Ornithinimicrobium sp.]|uniref:NUDIX hydrolase n=1 Tax=Ornithinimicrobium sp. TaxID=1977084 RepID=UPI002B4958D1|nr:NUDIX hydrolase [Ornithinimicrobium sp.]HKJ11735.1 NUDIX hydrolase [Ornithinimicrobium sp.]